MLDSAFVEAIADLAKQEPTIVKVNNRERLAMPDGKGAWKLEDLPMPEIIPAAVNLGTLDGFAGYVKDNRDGLDLEKHLAHVVSPTRVELLGPIGPEPFRQRSHPAVADLGQLIPATDGFAFGSFHECEAFVIALQSRFVQTPERDAVLKLVGNIRDESVRQVADDGVTQTVTARTGATLSCEVDVPNPVSLAPYRAFREIAQPESRFVLRLRRGGEGGKPTCALFEADGAGWRLEAIARVAEYLRKALETTKVTVVA